MPITLFALVIFWIVSHVFALAGLDHSLIYASLVAGMRDTYPHTQLIGFFAQGGLKPQSSQSLPPK
jgi:hypothetical protein